MLQKRSLSPLIATILLIVVSVILITVVLTWGSSFTKEKLNTTNVITNLSKSNISEFIWFDKLIGKKVFIKNLSDQSKTIVSYKIILSSNNSLSIYYENKIIPFNLPIIINSNTITEIPIECLPDNSFSIDLITTENEYINVKIKNNLLNDYFSCGLYGGWLFNEESGTTVYDYSKYSNNGTLINNVIRSSTNERQHAIDINNILNNSYVNITFPELFSDISNNDFTIAFWLNSNDLNVYSNWTRILDITKDSTNYVQFVIPAANKVQFLVRDSTAHKAVVINTNTNLNLNTWYFVTGVHNSKNNTVKIYINGVDKSSAGGTAAVSGSNNTFNIGRRSNNAGYYNGQLSDFRIYDRVLTNEEIMDLYEFTK